VLDQARYDVAGRTAPLGALQRTAAAAVFIACAVLPLGHAPVASAQPRDTQAEPGQQTDDAGQPHRGNTAPAAVLDIANQVAAAEARRSGVRAVARRYNTKRPEAEPGDDAQLDYTARVSFDQAGRFRGEIFQESHIGNTFETTFAWDGAKYTLRGTSPTQTPGKFVATLGYFDGYQADRVILATMLGMSITADANAPLSSTIRQYGVGLAPAELAPEPGLVGVRLANIDNRGDIRPSPNQFDVEVWLDPERDWLRVEQWTFDRHREAPVSFDRESVLALALASTVRAEQFGGVWLPTRVVARSWYGRTSVLSNGMTVEEYGALPEEERARIANAGLTVARYEMVPNTEWYLLMTVEEDSVETGVRFDDSEFVVPAQPGDLLHDEFEGVVYTVGENGERINERVEHGLFDDMMQAGAEGLRVPLDDAARTSATAKQTPASAGGQRRWLRPVASRPNPAPVDSDAGVKAGQQTRSAATFWTLVTVGAAAVLSGVIVAVRRKAP